MTGLPARMARDKVIAYVTTIHDHFAYTLGEQLRFLNTSHAAEASGARPYRLRWGSAGGWDNQADWRIVRDAWWYSIGHDPYVYARIGFNVRCLEEFLEWEWRESSGAYSPCRAALGSGGSGLLSALLWRDAGE